MTAPNVIRLVVDHALAEAEGEEAAAAELEQRAAGKRQRAMVLRSLYDLARPHAKPSTMSTMETEE